MLQERTKEKEGQHKSKTTTVEDLEEEADNMVVDNDEDWRDFAQQAEDEL